MHKEKESVLQKAALLYDAFVLILAFFAAYFLRQQFHVFSKLKIFSSSITVPESAISVSDYFIVLFIMVPLWCFILYLNGMYRSMRTRKIHEIFWIIVKSSFFLILAFSAIVFLFKLLFISRLFFVLFVIVGIVFILLEKITLFMIMHYVRKRGHNYSNLLVVGTGKRAVNILKKIQNHPEWGLRILGAIDDEPERGIEKVDSVDVIGGIDEISDILHKHPVNEVIFVVPRSRLNFVEEAIYVCETEGVKATIAVDLFNFKLARAWPTVLEGVPLITFETTVAREWELFVKRAVDFVLSGIGIVILSPLLAGVAVLIKLTSRGSVFFKQERAGLNGRRFVLYKFRTMYGGADKELASADVNNFMGDSEFKKKKVTYITPAGRFLRKFSIDELPQLFNVFAGHMSLVGPRPTAMDELVQYRPWQRRRLSMRPGITCLWQVSGRTDTDFEEWMKLDLEYIDNWSPWLDFKILMKTIPIVIFGIGAY